MDIQAIQKRLTMTTRGPWEANGPFVRSETEDNMLISLERYPGWEWDAEFIASAPDDVDALLAALTTTQAQLAAAEARIMALETALRPFCWDRGCPSAADFNAAEAALGLDDASG